MWEKAMRGLAEHVEVRSEDGQTMVEYSLILVTISIVSIVVIGVVGTDIGAMLSRVVDAF